MISLSTISLLLSTAYAADEYTIVLHPPTLSPGQQRGYTDAAAAAFSFLEKGNGADFSITLHGTDESAEDAKAAITSLARAESQRAQQEAADFQAEKALIGGSFLEPLGLLGAQKASQASLPTQINVNFQPGKTSFVEDAGRDTVLTLDLPAAFLEDEHTTTHVSKLFPEHTITQITELLTTEEVPEFHKMLARVDNMGFTDPSSAIKHLVEEHNNQVEHLTDEAHLTESFLNHQQQNPASGKMNACNYGRLLAQASYAMVNTSAHILTVMTSVACGCVYAGEFGMCILQKAAPMFPICESVQGVQKAIFAGSQNAWEAVKATTKTCDMPPSF